jgi:hypothetical protein
MRFQGPDDLQLQQGPQRTGVERRSGQPAVAVGAEGRLELVALGPLVVDWRAEVGGDVRLVAFKASSSGRTWRRTSMILPPSAMDSARARCPSVGLYRKKSVAGAAASRTA